MPEAPDAWADVAELIQLSRPSSVGPIEPPPPRAGPRRFWRATLSFLLLVVLPAGLAGAYLFGFAAPRYVAEARFVVRKPNAPMSPVAPSLASLDAGPAALGGDDSYAVRDYLLSRDAMQLVLQRAPLRADLVRAAHDPLWRFPGLLNGSSDERLYRVYKSLVSVDFEATTGVTTLSVQAFDPEDAKRIAEVLLQGGEGLLNQLGTRARRDAVRVAKAEVERTKDRARQALAAVTAFRNHQSMVDPLKLADTVLGTIAALSMQQADASTQLDIMQHASPNSPQIAPLRVRLAALGRQIDDEHALLGGGNGTYAPQIAAYERLTLEQSFAEKAYLSALTLLEMAQLDTLRQQDYLDQVVAPRAADEAASPHRVAWTAAVLLCGLLLFWVFRPPAPPMRRRVLPNA